MGASAEDKKELSNYVSFSPKLIFILMMAGMIGGTLYVLTCHGFIFSSKPSLIIGGTVGIIFMLMDIAASTGLIYILKAALSAYGKPMNRLLWWLISLNIISSILEGINSNLKIPFESMVSTAEFVLWIIVAVSLRKNRGKYARILGNIILISITVVFCYVFLKGSCFNLITGLGNEVPMPLSNVISFVDEALPMVFNSVLYLSIGLTLMPIKKDESN